MSKFDEELHAIEERARVRLIESFAPHPGDSRYIGDDEAGTPVYVQIEDQATSMFMGKTDGVEVWC